MHASPVPSLARQTSCAGPGRAGQPCPLPALPPPSPVLPGTWDWLLCQLFALVPSTDSQTTTTNSLEAKCSPHVWRSRSLSRTSLRSKQPHPAQQRFMYTRPTPDYLLVQPQPLLDREPVPVPGRLGRAVPTHTELLPWYSPPGATEAFWKPVLATVGSLLTGSFGGNKLSHRWCYQC